MKQLKIETKRGVLLDGVLFAADGGAENPSHMVRARRDQGTVLRPTFGNSANTIHSFH